MTTAKLDIVRTLVRQLPPREQLQLIAEGSQQLLQHTQSQIQKQPEDWDAEWENFVNDAEVAVPPAIDSVSLLSSMRR